MKYYKICMLAYSYFYHYVSQSAVSYKELIAINKSVNAQKTVEFNAKKVVKTPLDLTNPALATEEDIRKVFRAHFFYLL